MHADGNSPPTLCRLCQAPLRCVFADLGATPLANAFLSAEQLDEMEPHYPLRALVCERCLLVQLKAFAPPAAIFGDYAYFSSYSDTLLRHSREYVEMIVERLRLSPGDRVVEIASNDGYLLQYFIARGQTVLGIEPAANIAEAAVANGVPTLVRFFGSQVARRLVDEGRRPRLIVANNVMAHVPDLNDFVAGLKLLLAPRGLITIEFHHLLVLIQQRQFDTIYHEHFQYFSLATAKRALATHGLKVIDVEEFPTQGGSLRVYACHEDDESQQATPKVEELLAREEAAGLHRLASYPAFGEQIRDMKLDLLAFLVSAKQARKSIVCYGAAAKGNTLLNFCGVGTDFVDYAVDRSPHKQGLYLPGSHIPIYKPDKIKETKPDYLLVLPWNILEEVMEQTAYVRSWGGRFVVPIPEVQVLP